MWRYRHSRYGRRVRRFAFLWLLWRLFAGRRRGRGRWYDRGYGSYGGRGGFGGWGGWGNEW